MNNPKTRQQWILDLLKSEPTMSYVDCWGKYGVKWGRKENTFTRDWKIAQQHFKEYQTKVNKAKDDASIKEELKPLKKGLKLKIDRLLVLQGLVDKCLIDLSEGMTDDVYMSRKTGKPIEYRRKMVTSEVNQTRRTLKDLQAEISKIEGDYAPEKIKDVTEDKKIIFEIVNAGNKNTTS